ncbi:hypothetical protein ABBQ38_008345 [Trebouxia sp. C0009 RCD-2024]
MRWSKFNKFSAYARADSHLVSQTSYGALVTLSGAALAVLLFFAEIGRFHAATRVTTLGVDTSRGDLLRITLDITLPALPCAAISLDAIDIAGTHGDDNTLSVAHNGELHKNRINADGSRKGLGEYIAPKRQFGPFVLRRPQEENAAMNAALDKHEGCNIQGWLEVQRVAGNFHLSVHADHYFAMRSTQEEIQRVLKEQLENHDVQRALQVPTDTTTINMSHVIHHMAFGPQYPGQINPLDAYSRISDVDTGTFKYFIKVVPTEYQGRSGKKMLSNQYSLTEYYSPVQKGEVQLPAIYFLYDLSPIMVSIKDARASIAHLLVRLCAVIGGVFAITGMCDRWLHWLVTTLQTQQGNYTYAAS